MAKDTPYVIATGSLTQANTRISAVDGTAFIDTGDATFTAALTAAVTHNDVLEIYDSSKRKISAFVKAMGSAETLDSELIVNGDMELDEDWVSWGPPTSQSRSNEQAHGGTYSRKIIAGSALQGIQSVSLTTTTQGLYKYSAWVYSVDIAHNYIYLRKGSGATLWEDDFLPTANQWVQISRYRTETAGGPNADTLLLSQRAQTLYYDDVTYKKVLTPSTSGCTLTNSPGGTTYNFGSKDASFNYNDASGYTWRIVSSTAYSKLIATYAVTKTHIATVNAGAMFWDEDNSLAAYAGTDAGSTPYLIVFYDNAGKTCRGYGGAVGTGLTKDAAKTITGITKANPGIVTYQAGHGHTGGELVYYSGLTEMTSLNTKYKSLGTKSGDTFQLGDLSAETAAETTGGACSERVTEVGNTGLHLHSTKNGTDKIVVQDSGFNQNGIVKINVYRAQ